MEDREGQYKRPTITSKEPSGEHEQNWYNRSHKELVHIFNSLFEERYKQFGGHWPIELIIRNELNSQGNTKPQREFFYPIEKAWDALAYDRYEPGSSHEMLAGSSLYYHASCIDGGPTIILSDPLQVKIIDALTEVARIPHQKGLTEIEIPEKIQNWDSWLNSAEYKNRVAQARKEK